MTNKIFFNLALVLVLLFGCNPVADQSETAVSTPSSQEKIWTEKDRQFILKELERTSNELLKETEKLALDQWTFRENPTRWNIAEIVEHLILQNELHYREIYAVSNAPALPQYLPITTGHDDHFLSYATDPVKSHAKWFLQPLGRFDSKRQSIAAFQRARDGIRGFVEKTEIDLRQHFTFRNQAGNVPIDSVKIGDVMDLHQFLLTGIAHTDRHLVQIRNIKKHKLYPRDI
ncbi:MAG: DinB family protein [Saprospiraceae bacterium]